jgi:hypothetical protein
MMPAKVWTGGRFVLGLGAVTATLQGEEPGAAPGRAGDGAMTSTGGGNSCATGGNVQSGKTASYAGVVSRVAVIYNPAGSPAGRSGS